MTRAEINAAWHKALAMPTQTIAESIAKRDKLRQILELIPEDLRIIQPPQDDDIPNLWGEWLEGVATGTTYYIQTKTRPPAAS